MNIKILLMSALALSLSACASMSNKFEADRAKNVRKVAVVAIEIQQQKPTDNWGISALKTIAAGRDGDSKELQSMAKGFADNFTASLEKKTSWNVMPIDKVMANPLYKSKTDAAMTGMRQTLPLEKNAEGVYLKGMMDVYAFRKMTVADRDQLAKSLGVDALAELVVFTSMDQSWLALGHISGNAAFNLKSRANFQVYGRSSEDPLWRAQNHDGEQTESSDALPEKLSRLERMSTLGQKAAISAGDKLLQSYPL